MEPRSELHVIFGAGQVGTELARQLMSDGRSVRLVRRSAGAGPPGVALVRADARDRAAVGDAPRGAAVIYHCMNAPYSAAIWAEELPRLQENLVTASVRANARLVVLDNLYALGRTGGRPMSEATPFAPCSRKGEIRARLAESLEASRRAGTVRAVTGRASDFFGPGGVNSYFEKRLFGPALAGKKAAMIVEPDTRHTYHFIPDVAAGLATLGADAGADGTFMLPCEPAVTTRELIALMATALGKPIAFSRVPPLALRLAGLAVPIVRELNEMAYQWEQPFVVNDAKFRARYGDRSTPLAEGARRTVEWAVASFGRAGA